ncbi:Mediator of RNA polymerase II transcription subunit 18 [Schistosoma japonicum]|nr:Mediator of RNA polymerase II transcription subunit 18 [Schistosoma japonicum]
MNTRILPDDTISVLPGESGSIAEVIGPVEGLAQPSSGEPIDRRNAIALTAAFNFTGTTPSANGATMQEYFLQTVVSSPIQHELLLNRLHGLCREWTDFCDQETTFEIGSDNRTDASNLIGGGNRSSGNTSAAVGVLAATASGSTAVSVRVRRSLLSKVNKPGREFSVLRYLGAVETDKIILRRSCLEMPVTGPIISFLYDLGFEYESTYIAEGQEFIRGRVKVLVYTVNEITSFQSIATSNAMGFGFDGQGLAPKEWRRVCSRSWMVEISIVGSPADDHLQEEISDFVELLHPIIIPTKLDIGLSYSIEFRAIIVANIWC